MSAITHTHTHTEQNQDQLCWSCLARSVSARLSGEEEFPTQHADKHNPTVSDLTQSLSVEVEVMNISEKKIRYK